MILFKKFELIDDNLYQKLDKFILTNFDNSRLDTYEYVIYMTDDNSENIIGFVGLQTIDFNIIINQLCVSINHRNQGIATQLLEYIESQFKNFKYYLYIHNINNTKLYNYYNKRGFKELYRDNVKIKMIKS
jgi:N-acetylglutamate synthase-like GNAT family acetyltransferase